MKKHSILKVIMCMVLIAVLCTWIFPTISFGSELVEETTRSQVGIFDLAKYVVDAFRYFPHIIIMTLVIGMFYGVAYRISAYRKLLDVIASKFKGKENIFLAVVMALMAIIVSVSGLSFGMLFVFPFVISVVLLMGYNKLVAASVTVGSTIVGLLGTTLGTVTNDYINYVLSTDAFSEIIAKIVILIISLVLLIYNVLRYANKTKNNTDKVVELVPAEGTSEIKKDKEVIKEEVKQDKKSNKDSKASTSKKTKTVKADSKSTKKDSKSTSKKKTTKSTKKSTKDKAYDLKSRIETKIIKPKKKSHVWPFVVVFDLVLVILAVSTFDWNGVFEITWFTKALDAVKEFTIFDFPIFAKILGDVKDFGSWTLYYEMPMLIFLATCFLAFIYGLKFNDFLDGIIDGVKKAMQPAIYMFITYLVLFIVVYHPFQLHFTKFLVNLTDGLNVITMTIVAMISSIFNIESLYTAQGALPYVTSVITDKTLYPLIGVIFQSIYGLMMLIAPTSIILLGTLTYLDISYIQWIKHIWKLFLQLLVVLVVIFLLLLLI